MTTDPFPRPARADDPDAAEPCPYCGAETRVRDSACRSCRRRLLIESPPATDRAWARILLGLWYGALTAGVAGYGMLGFVFGAMLAVLAGQWDEILSGPLLTLLVGAILSGLLFGTVGVGVLKGLRVAYLAHIALLAGAIPLALTPLIFPAAAAAVLFLGGAPGDPTAAQAAAREVVLGSLGVLAALVVVTAFSHSEFYGGLVRVRTRGLAPSADPSRAGLRYSALGMWYLAVHELERAATLRPRDGSVHHALGRAYARLGRYPEALAALRAAQSLSPSPAIAADIEAALAES